MMETVRGKLWFVAILIALAIVAFIAVSMYDRGYRIAGGRILFPATVAVIAPQGSALEFDSKPVVLGPTGEATVIRTVSGIHTVGVTREGYWPWGKEFEVASEAEVVFRPFLVPRTTEGDVIERSEAEYAIAERAVLAAVLPSRETPVLSPDGQVALFIEGSEIKAKWQGDATPPLYFCTEGPCTDDLSVLVFDAELRSLSFLPGRSDVILFAAQNGVFALELDKRGIQNFQPVYKGVRPSFVVVGTTIYMKDSTSLFRVRVE